MTAVLLSRRRTRGRVTPTPNERYLQEGIAAYFADPRRYTADAAAKWLELCGGLRKGLVTLPEHNTKMLKTADVWPVMNLNLSPADESGYENCVCRTPACTFHCLNTAGHNGIGATPREARIRRTRFLWEHPPLFMAQYVRELDRAVHRYPQWANRFNTLSDQRIELIAPQLLERFANVQFYDYTKHPPAARTERDNYDLTYSIAEKHTLADVDALLESGHRCAMVLAPTSHFRTDGRFPVIDGDASDLRFLDPKGVVCALKPKGRARRITPADEGSFVR